MSSSAKMPAEAFSAGNPVAATAAPTRQRASGAPHPRCTVFPRYADEGSVHLKILELI